MISMNVHFKSQRQKVLLSMGNSTTHFLEHVSRGESFGFATLLLSNNTIAFLSPYVTSVVSGGSLAENFRTTCDKN